MTQCSKRKPVAVFEMRRCAAGVLNRFILFKISNIRILLIVPVKVTSSMKIGRSSHDRAVATRRVSGEITLRRKTYSSICFGSTIPSQYVCNISSLLTTLEAIRHIWAFQQYPEENISKYVPGILGNPCINIGGAAERVQRILVLRTRRS